MPLSVNIKNSPYNAVGDTQLVTDQVTIASGSTSLATAGNWFVSGDVGKQIVVPGAGSSGNILATTIAAFHAANHVDLAAAAATALFAVSTLFAWGTDDSPAFSRFHSDGVAASGLVSLTIPAGGYFNASLDPNTIRWCRGIAQLVVTGVGTPTLVGNHELGGITFPNKSGFSGRINQAKHGDTTITLLNAGDVATFTAGNTYIASDGTVYVFGSKIKLSAIDMQGFGDPNHFLWEYATMVSISGLTITLASPIQKGPYLTTYPLYNSGDAFHPDCGGPATAYPFDASWDNTSLEFIGINFYKPQLYLQPQVKAVKFTNCKAINPFSSFGITPSCNDTHTWDNCDLTDCFIEVDKTVSVLNSQNGTRGHVLWFQSASVEQFNCTNSTWDRLQGTAKNTYIADSQIGELDIGPQAYGRADTLIANNSSFGSIIGLGVIDQDITANGFSLVGGVIKYGKTSPVRWGIPGTSMMFQGQRESETSFIVTGLSSDGTNTLVGTTLSGSSFPNVPLEGGTRLDVMAHPCPYVYFTNCTGCDAAKDLSQIGAQGKPLWSYTKRQYTGDMLTFSPGHTPTPMIGPHLWGRITSVKITVSKAYSGNQSALTLQPFGQFAANALDPNNSLTSWAPVIDLKMLGTRIITPTSTSGAVGIDHITAPGLIWFAGQQPPFLNADVSGESSAVWPIVIIEVTADQGTLPTPTPPHRAAKVRGSISGTISVKGNLIESKIKLKGAIP